MYIGYLYIGIPIKRKPQHRAPKIFKNPILYFFYSSNNIFFQKNNRQLQFATFPNLRPPLNQPKCLKNRFGRWWGYSKNYVNILKIVFSRMFRIQRIWSQLKEYLTQNRSLRFFFSESDRFFMQSFVFYGYFLNFYIETQRFYPFSEAIFLDSN